MYIYMTQSYRLKGKYFGPFHSYAAAAIASVVSDPIDGSPPGFPIPGILQARMLEWVAIAFSLHSYIHHKKSIDQMA